MNLIFARFLNYETTLFDAGKVLPVNTKTIPDYAVVPILGFEVKMTVGEVVTHAWVVSTMGPVKPRNHLQRADCFFIRTIDSNVKKLFWNMH